LKQSKPQGAVKLLCIAEFISSSFSLRFLSGFDAKIRFDFKDATAPKKMRLLFITKFLRVIALLIFSPLFSNSLFE